MDAKAEKKFIEDIRRTFTALAMRCPFSYPLLTLNIKLSENIDCVAATDAASIIINPSLWSALNKNQKMFVALHEWLHIALLHPKRIRTRQVDIYNAAADFVVNSMIVSDYPDFEIPPGKILLDNQYYYKSVEEIYKDIELEVRKRKENPQSNKKSGQPSSQNNKHLNKEEAIEQLLSQKSQAKDVMEMSSEVNESDLIDSIIRAAARHKLISHNRLPGGYEDHINQIRKSSVPWTRIFARLAKQALKKATDRNPFKPDPKYLPFDVFIPTETSSGVPNVVLIVDTSGSMDSEEFEYALGHIEKVCAVCEKVTLITSDTEVHDVIRIRNLKNQLKNNKISFKGRGGTDMGPAFKKAETLRPDLIILYSDLYLPHFPPKPKAPVIFLSRYHHTTPPPYGTYIYIKDSQ